MQRSCLGNSTPGSTQPCSARCCSATTATSSVAGQISLRGTRSGGSGPSTRRRCFASWRVAGTHGRGTRGLRPRCPSSSRGRWGGGQRGRRAARRTLPWADDGGGGEGRSRIVARPMRDDESVKVCAILRTGSRTRSAAIRYNYYIAILRTQSRTRSAAIRCNIIILYIFKNIFHSNKKFIR